MSEALHDSYFCVQFSWPCTVKLLTARNKNTSQKSNSTTWLTKRRNSPQKGNEQKKVQELTLQSTWILPLWEVSDRSSATGGVTEHSPCSWSSAVLSPTLRGAPAHDKRAAHAAALGLLARLSAARQLRAINPHSIRTRPDRQTALLLPPYPSPGHADRREGRQACYHREGGGGRGGRGRVGGGGRGRRRRLARGGRQGGQSGQLGREGHSCFHRDSNDFNYKIHFKKN